MSPIKLKHRQALAGVAALTVILVIVGLTTVNAFYLTTIMLSIILAIAALGLFLLLGLAGQVSLGQAAFFGVGAYAVGNLVERAHLEPLLAICAASLIAAAVGWVVARPLLRLSGNSLAMATLALGIVMSILFGQLRDWTGGMDPGFSMKQFHFFGTPMGDARSMYWICAAALVLVVWMIINLLHSRFGRALRALNTSEVAAAGTGIPIAEYKTVVFSIAAGTAGLAGALYAFALRSFNATSFGFSLSIELLIIVIIGSLRSVWGALFGAMLVTILPTVLEGFQDYKIFAYGVAMVLIMMFMPDGLFHEAVSALRGIRRKGGK